MPERRQFIAKQGKMWRFGTDKVASHKAASLGKDGVFGQKTPTGQNRFAPGLNHSRKDIVLVSIGRAAHAGGNHNICKCCWRCKAIV